MFSHSVCNLFQEIYPQDAIELLPYCATYLVISQVLVRTPIEGKCYNIWTMEEMAHPSTF